MYLSLKDKVLEQVLEVLNKKVCTLYVLDKVIIIVVYIIAIQTYKNIII